MNRSIMSPDLPTMIKHSLLNAGVNTLGDLAMLTFDDLHKIRNIGKESVRSTRRRFREPSIVDLELKCKKLEEMNRKLSQTCNELRAYKREDEGIIP